MAAATQSASETDPTPSPLHRVSKSVHCYTLRSFALNSKYRVKKSDRELTFEVFDARLTALEAAAGSEAQNASEIGPEVPAVDPRAHI